MIQRIKARPAPPPEDSSSPQVRADLESTVLIPPEDYLTRVRALLGTIDLDPCSTARAQRSIEAMGWFRADQAQAALAEPWSGRVFLHPHPNPSIARYQVQKLLRDYLADRVSAGVLLVNRTDMLRSEPLLLSFPFLLHYRRLPYWRYDRQSDRNISHSPSFNSFTSYLPAKDGHCFNEEKLTQCVQLFSPYGRVILTEDFGENWEQQALLASARMATRPVLPLVTIERYDPS